MIKFLGPLFLSVITMIPAVLLAMDLPKERPTMLPENVAHFHHKGASVAKLLIAEVLRQPLEMPLQASDCVKEHRQTIEEIVKHLADHTIFSIEHLLVCDRLRAYVKGFAEEMDDIDLDALFLTNVGSEHINPSKVIRYSKIKMYERFYRLVLELGKIVKVENIKANLAKIPSQEDYKGRKLSSLLGYYFDFGQRYGQIGMPALFKSTEDDIRRAKGVEEEYFQYCHPLIISLLNKNFSVHYYRAWHCLYAFSQGVLSKGKSFELDRKKYSNFLATEKHSAASPHGVRIALFYTKIKLIELIATNGPLNEAKEIVNGYMECMKMIDEVQKRPK